MLFVAQTLSIPLPKSLGNNSFVDINPTYKILKSSIPKVNSRANLNEKWGILNCHRIIRSEYENKKKATYSASNLEFVLMSFNRLIFSTPHKINNDLKSIIVGNK